MTTPSTIHSSRRAPSDCAICVDMGTTNTRAWLVAENKIIARESAAVGVRDSARTGNSDIVHHTLRELFHALQSESLSTGSPPTMVLGAGMITSSLGLLEMDHVPAPAGEAELAGAMGKILNPEITELPIWLVPGVRTGPSQPGIADLPEVDVIRGEETLCVGLQRQGILPAHSTLLNLGSHWKAITLDGSGRIASSFTTLSGELIHAIQEHTVLSSALPQGRFAALDLYWLEQGRIEQERSGLSRALFCVRLLELKFRLTPLERSSFLVGAVVASDLAAARKNQKLAKKIVITGSGAVTEAWKTLLEAEKFRVSVCDAQTMEAAFITGLLRLRELGTGPGSAGFGA